MKNLTQKLFVAGACALLFTPASAQFLAREKATQQVNAPVSLQSATANGVKAVNGKKQGKRLQLLSVRKADATNPYAQYGEFEEVLNEDFSKLTTGSFGNPDFDTNLYDAFKRVDPYDNSTYEIPWYSFNPAYLNTQGVYDEKHEAVSRWGESDCYPAGGALYMYLKEDDEDTESSQAHVNTCLIDCSKYQGDVILQFDAYTDAADKTNPITLVEAAETNGMGSSWDQLGSLTLPEINSEKKTYTILFRGGDKSTLFNICGQRGPLERGEDPVGNSFYIDNIKVSVLKPYVNSPENLQMKYYKGDNFKLSWDAVEGADKYLVDVYTKQIVKNDYGYTTSEVIGDYLYKDEETNTNSLQVTDAKNGQIYYYRVRAVKGNNVSMESNEEKQILGVVAPELKPVESTADSKYTASWEAVPGAEVYNYEAYAANKITEAQKVAVAEANFEGMPYNHGFSWKRESYGEIIEQYDSPKYSTTDMDPSGTTSTFTSLEKVPGWSAYCWALYKDALVIDGYQSYYNGNNVSLQCAPMDLSKDNGKFDVTLTLKAEDSQMVDANNNPAYTHAALALFTYDAELDDYVQAETKFISNLDDKGWKTSTNSFTKGTDNSIFGIFATYAPAYLFIHDFKIEQNYAAGETFMKPFTYWYRFPGVPTTVDGKDGYSIEIPLEGETNGKDVYHRIQSVRLGKEASYFTNATFAESEWSKPTLVAENVVTGIQQSATVGKKSATVFMEGDNLVINNPAGNEVHVYSMNGTELNADKSGNATVKMATPAESSFIVKVGKQSIKIAIVK